MVNSRKFISEHLKIFIECCTLIFCLCLLAVIVEWLRPHVQILFTAGKFIFYKIKAKV